MVIVIARDNPKQFQYWVEGVMEWKLLNITVYAQEKSYKGFAMV
jgi:hypothetical protein